MMEATELILPEFPSSLIPRIERYATQLEQANPGVKFSLTMCISTLLVRALAEIEGRQTWGRRKWVERRRVERGSDRRQNPRRWRDRVADHATREVLTDMGKALAPSSWLGDKPSPRH